MDSDNSSITSNAELKEDALSEIQIPFISQISYYISQKKKENVKLENYQKNLKDDIKKLEIQKNKVIDSLNQINQNEKTVLSNVTWFYKLKKELWENHYIKIEDDIQNFSYLINDFKEHGYRADEIIKEYLKSFSLKAQIMTLESHITKLSEQRASLNNSVLYLKSEIEDHRQTLDVYSQLRLWSLD